MTSVQSLSSPARLASPEEGISTDELALAARNHGLPLEALRYDLTPPGLHYLLIHYDIPFATDAEWMVTVTGSVARSLTLDMAAIRELPRRTVAVTMECAGNGRARLHPRPVSQPWMVEAVGTANWTGTPLAGVLEAAGVTPDAVEVVFTGADHGVERGVEQDYQRSLSLTDAMADDVLLCYEMNGEPLLPQHGFPLRLIVPGWYGMAHVKWLRDITVVDTPFQGFQQVTAYRLRQEPDEVGEPVTRIFPRALLVPPGFPDFMSRRRFARPGPIMIEGRAWSGWGPVVSVEVSADGGATWAPATIDAHSDAAADGAADPVRRWAWQRWTFLWDATPGAHELCARATDGTGRVQPLDDRWNRGGFANNAVQRVPVTVE
ncbi:sulfite oxidase [Pseudofrankia inefficax]|uniref:Nitrate reductase (NADH) n=1 Tax=Pseudofrankia inefficax (strain DSM 45817 / CECT 9037 / DDB 130130 / EuI1c) TaxID=298654 RepID=E3J9U3_PSEI1|nr:sulfite oxidase [Pseudofrankia inefficax]ADP84596.1 Nitrate reductase (NADH) [Pseudofrankia inefficax]